MQRNFLEKRRKTPSYTIPIIFFLLEIVLLWLTIGLFSWELDVYKWSIFAYIVAAAWLAFSAMKLRIVLKRQKSAHD